MCDKAVVETPGPLESVSDCYKNQTIRDKAVNIYALRIKFFPECY